MFDSCILFTFCRWDRNISRRREKNGQKYRNKLVYHFLMAQKKRSSREMSSHPVEFKRSFTRSFQRTNEISELSPVLLSRCYIAAEIQWEIDNINDIISEPRKRYTHCQTNYHRRL